MQKQLEGTRSTSNGQLQIELPVRWSGLVQLLW